MKHIVVYTYEGVTYVLFNSTTKKFTQLNEEEMAFYRVVLKLNPIFIPITHEHNIIYLGELPKEIHDLYKVLYKDKKCMPWKEFTYGAYHYAKGNRLEGFPAVCYEDNRIAAGIYKIYNNTGSVNDRRITFFHGQFKENLYRWILLLK